MALPPPRLLLTLPRCNSTRRRASFRPPQLFRRTQRTLRRTPPLHRLSPRWCPLAPLLPAVLWETAVLLLLRVMLRRPPLLSELVLVMALSKKLLRPQLLRVAASLPSPRRLCGRRQQPLHPLLSSQQPRPQLRLSINLYPQSLPTMPRPTMPRQHLRMMFRSLRPQQPQQSLRRSCPLLETVPLWSMSQRPLTASATIGATAPPSPSSTAPAASSTPQAPSSSMCCPTAPSSGRAIRALMCRCRRWSVRVTYLRRLFRWRICLRL